MQIWLDTINLKVVADAAKTGIIAGITTNPSILSRTQNVKETLTRLLDMQKGCVAVQVTAQDVENMVEEGEHIFEFSSRMIIKVPVNNNGLVAMHQLCEKKIPVLGTGIFHPSQALLAANHGAAYISPYFSHIDNAHETLKTIATILRTTPYKTKLLAASLRNLDDLLYCSLLGADAVTIKDDLYYKLVADHYLWEKFSQQFIGDWQQTHGNASIKDLLSTKEKSVMDKFECLSGVSRVTR